ncbi:hypothetical protein [Zooshikella sp. RANM57]|uniref:hypothetical protein n=1 Tax=Zooshikella sp. RANM57 TaxID=3425863 RepID=UPI003D6E3E74
MPDVIINGIRYVPSVEIPKLTDERLLSCLESLIEIQYFKESHKSIAIAWNALYALAPELAKLASKDAKAAYFFVEKMREEQEQ